jgi:hypothetical protein
MSDGKITMKELEAKFGGRIPMWAVNILFDSPADWTVQQVRDAIDARLAAPPVAGEYDVLAKRLIAWARDMQAGRNCFGADQDLREAADALAAMQARVKELEQALEDKADLNTEEFPDE